MNKKTLQGLVYFSVTLLLLSGCDQKIDEESENEEITVNVPSFNADSAYAFVEKQISFGPRVPNTSAHKACGDYLVKKLTGYGATVQTQEFEASAYDGTVLNLRNIIASFNPDARKRILLAAHWDTRPFADKDSTNKNTPIDGANDGGSGVAVLLEYARIFNADSLPRVGVDMILFDGEDYGEPENYQGYSEAQNQVWWCLGSQHWSENKHEPGYSAYYGVLFDMVGAENARFFREGVSMSAAPSIVKKIWDEGHRLGFGQYFVYENSSEIVDDHVYVNYNAKIPMVDIIEHDPNSSSFFGSYHHTQADNMSIISRKTLNAVGTTVLHVIYREKLSQ
jgi:glutaminyl-peptide cyclotransferase